MQLNEKEILILRKLAEGKSFKQIAADLGETKSCVNMTLSRCRVKHNLNNTPHLLATAFREKLIA